MKSQSTFDKFAAEAAAICPVLAEIGKPNDAFELALAFNLAEECGFVLSQMITDKRKGKEHASPEV